MNTNSRLTPVLGVDNKIKQFIIKSFTCHCSCNVFHKPDDTRLNLYECDACGEWYESE